jgi:hypothetical protein
MKKLLVSLLTASCMNITAATAQDLTIEITYRNHQPDKCCVFYSATGFGA